ncbi:hypothetical protein [Chitinophaga sp.]|uniref:hypothetical protein n=1 Tax=Chitinophaga sp. TaxID=1869181 RepID=UPI0031CE65D0
MAKKQYAGTKHEGGKKVKHPSQAEAIGLTTNKEKNRGPHPTGEAKKAGHRVANHG